MTHNVRTATSLVSGMFETFEDYDEAEVMTAVSTAAVIVFARHYAGGRKEFVKAMGIVWDKCPHLRAAAKEELENEPHP